MYVYVLLKNGKYMGVYRSYEAACEAKSNQYFDSDFPPVYEILEERI